MGRLRRKSIAIEKSEKRLAGLKAIDPTLDFGNGLTVTNYESLISSTRILLHDYNQHIATLDDMLNTIVKNEKELKSQHSRFLSAVFGRFGHDSTQYEQIGGKRISQRKKTPRVKKATQTKTD